MNHHYLFTQKELKVLLKAKGYTFVTGIRLDAEHIGSNEVAGIVNSLFQKEMIINDHNGFVVIQEVSAIIHAIGGAKGFVSIRTSNPYLPDLCCYRYDGRLYLCEVMERCNRDIRIFCGNEEEILCLLDEEGYFPKDEQDFPFTDEELEVYETHLEHYQDNIPVDENACILFEMKKHHDKSARKMEIIRYPLFNYIRNDNQDDRQRYICCFTNIRKSMNLFFADREE